MATRKSGVAMEIISPVLFVFSLNMTKFANDSLFGKNKAIIMPLTRRFHGNLIGTPTKYNLGLIVLLSTNQN